MKVISAKEAVAKIKDRSSVVATGFVGSGFAEYILETIEQEFLATGTPKDLTVIWDAALGNGRGMGVDHLGHKGLIKEAITCHLNMNPKLQKMIGDNEIPAQMLPLGAVAQLYREMGAGKPGLFSKIGLGTFVDPRIEGGKCNAKSTKDYVKVVEVEGEEYLFYKAFPMDVAIIRGTSVDQKGNLTCEKECVISDMMVAARAVKRNGGIVIAQVERVVANGSLNARDVIVPGIMIDYVVVAPLEKHKQTAATAYNPAWAQEYRVQLDSLEALPLDERKIIARRAAMEIKENSIINLGFGMPEGLASVAAEEGFAEAITMTVECGHIGGVPASGLDFGGCYNPDYVVDMVRQFEWYEGGSLDAAFLGAAEVDQYGNANVTKFGRIVGPGGFINIAHTAKSVCYCGTFTAGGLEIAVEDGKLRIVNEGKAKKYIADVEQISFSAKYALKEKQKIKYITERAVFDLTLDGIVLTEIAPGIDLKTQVLDQVVGFELKVSPDLKLMDERIFRDEKMGIKPVL